MLWSSNITMYVVGSSYWIECIVTMENIDETDYNFKTWIPGLLLSLVLKSVASEWATFHYS